MVQTRGNKSGASIPSSSTPSGKPATSSRTVILEFSESSSSSSDSEIPVSQPPPPVERPIPKWKEESERRPLIKMVARKTVRPPPRKPTRLETLADAAFLSPSLSPEPSPAKTATSPKQPSSSRPEKSKGTLEVKSKKSPAKKRKESAGQVISPQIRKSSKHSTSAEPKRTESQSKPQSEVPRKVKPSSSTVHDRKLEIFRGRTVVECRKIDFELLRSWGVSIDRIFEKAKWLNFMKLDVAVYPDLVRQFYCNLEEVGTHEARTFVKRKELRFSVNDIAEVIGAPNEGAERYVTHTWPKIENFINFEAARLVYDDPTADGNVLPHDFKMSIENQFLHRLISHSILPRLTKHFKVTFMDCALMYMLLKEWQYNLPWLVLTIMKQTASRNIGFLPYGNVITLLLGDFNFEGEEKWKCAISPLGDKGLHRMQLKKKKGVFVRTTAEVSFSDDDKDDQSSSSSEKDAARPSQETFPAAHTPGTSSQPQPSSSQHDSTLILSAISKLDDHVRQLDNFVRQHLTDLSSRMDHIEKKLSKKKRI